MTGDESNHKHDAEPMSEGADADDDAAIGRLLQSALAEPPPPRIQFLPAIQERIRKRTRGRYYREQPRALRDPTLLILGAACLLLVLSAFLYVVLESIL